MENRRKIRNDNEQKIGRTYEPIIQMGCISTKNRKPQNFPLQTQTFDPETELKKQPVLMRAETCSTVATFSAATSTRSKIRRTTSIKVGDQGWVNEYLSTINTQCSASQSLISMSIIAPWTKSDPILLNCAPENFSLCLQFLHGYSYENCHLSRVDRLQSCLEQAVVTGQEMIKRETVGKISAEYHLIQVENAQIFIKLLLQCPACLLLSTITQSRTLFDINYANCDCNSQIMQICILKKQPKSLMIWCDETNKYILDSNQKQTQLLKRKSKLRVIGCTSCWSLKDCQTRTTCSCPICNKCLTGRNICLICFK